MKEPMRIIILDPLLKDQSGHQFFYAAKLKKELESRGAVVLCLGNEAASKECDELGGFYPCLNDIAGSIFRSGRLPDLFAVWKLVRELERKFAGAFFGGSGPGLQDNDLVICHDLYPFEFLAFCLFVRRYRGRFLRKNCRFEFLFGFSYARASGLETFFLACLYKFCDWLLSGTGTVYFADGRLLQEQYERLLRKKVYFSPMPVFPLPISADIARIEPDVCAVAFLGGARYNKGFDIVVEALADITGGPGLAAPVRFFIQVDVHRNQFEKDKLLSEAAAGRLREFGKKDDRIRIIPGHLSAREYYRLLEDSDVILLPYRSGSFQTVPSNVFVEAVVAGKIPVVSGGTTMADFLRRHGMDELIMERYDPACLADKIRLCAGQRERLLKAAGAAAKDMSELNSVGKLADALLAKAAPE